MIEGKDGCGLEVPPLTQRLADGVSHLPRHPNFAKYTDIGSEGLLHGALMALGLDRTGRRIHLPSTSPHFYPPYGGATQNWSGLSWDTVAKLRKKLPGAVCATYPGHGRTGEPWGIDVQLSTFNQQCNKAEEEAGDRLTYWAVRPPVWEYLGLDYVIWWNWMIDDPAVGWFYYEPYRLKWSGGSQLLIPSRHMDHAHFQRRTW